MNQGAIGDGLPAGCERPVTLGVLTDVAHHLPLAMSTVDLARLQFGRPRSVQSMGVKGSFTRQFHEKAGDGA
jgi:hypothetical protein